MKKLVFLFLIAVTAVSCDLDDKENIQYVVGPVQDVTMATAYKKDSVSEIKIRYTRPTECHIFNGIYYDINGNTRTVAIQFAKLAQSDCQADSTETAYEVPLNFRPLHSGTYVFKFWDGSNEDGTDHFTEYEAVVPE